MLGIGIGIQSTSIPSNAGGDPTPPEGFAFVTQDGEIVTQDGEPVYVPEE